MIPPFVALWGAKILKELLPQIAKFLWKYRDVVLLIALVFCLWQHCAPSKAPTGKPPIKEIVKEKPIIRYVTPSDSLTKAIYDSIYSRFKDSVEVKVVRRDRVKIVEGDTIVITDSVEIEVPRCWNELHRLLQAHTATNSYVDTIVVIDSVKRRRRDTTAVIYLTEDVQKNEIKLRKVSYQHFGLHTVNKKIRFYGGLSAGGNKGMAIIGPSVLIGGNKVAGGVSYLVTLDSELRFKDYYTGSFYYRIGK